MSDIKTTAAAVYQTLQDLHAAFDTGGDVAAALEAHHAALNELRKCFAPWEDFLSFIGVTVAQTFSGGTGEGGKDAPPPPPGK